MGRVDDAIGRIEALDPEAIKALGLNGALAKLAVAAWLDDPGGVLRLELGKRRQSLETAEAVAAAVKALDEPRSEEVMLLLLDQLMPGLRKQAEASPSS